MTTRYAKAEVIWYSHIVSACRSGLPNVRTFALIFYSTSIAAFGAELVTIEGGHQGQRKHYRWTITNHRESPVVLVEFPHYLARLFIAPEGWSTESTNLVNVGVKEKTGTCRAVANSPHEGILSGESATFDMKLANRSAAPRLGTVRIRFADGLETRIAQVQVPGKELVGDKYMSLIGLGAIFMLWLIVGRLRRRKPA